MSNQYNGRFGGGTKMNRVYRTDKGTELPILSFKGRDYLEVKYRLVWFREEHPDWSIETEMVTITDTSAFVRAIVKDEQGRIIATSHKYETRQGFPDFIEKAETGAIGRALALIGYGTQFCADELDEGERIVDSPIDVIRSREAASESRRNGALVPPAQTDPGSIPDDRATEEVAALHARGGDEEARSIGDASDGESQEQLLRQGRLDPGDYRIGFGKKYKGKRLREIPRQEIESYVDWLEANAEKKGVPLSDEARFLKMAVGRYLMEGQAH